MPTFSPAGSFWRIVDIEERRRKKEDGTRKTEDGNSILKLCPGCGDREKTISRGGGRGTRGAEVEGWRPAPPGSRLRRLRGGHTIHRYEQRTEATVARICGSRDLPPREARPGGA